MSSNYKFHNPDGLYFVSFAVVYWLDVFTRDPYRTILLNSLSFCQKEKGLEVVSWCIMTNHIHLIFRSINGQHPSLLLGDYKRFTSKSLVKAIRKNPKESRKDFFMQEFRKAGKNSYNVKNYQFWRHDNHPIELWSNPVIWQKIKYIHNNPVKAGMVFRAEDYRYSSAIDYADGKGLLDDVLVFKYYG